ncbi:MAG: hypothetical protein KatS3mg110_4677 [Pirellulaceae bacterium]|nr:MAG: hypothetical protein KatS3mg110_4677 [Pirellulaceae bacterium]
MVRPAYGRPESYDIHHRCRKINSLFRLKASSRDHVYLLHWETPDGQTCAEEVRKALCWFSHNWTIGLKGIK